MYKNHKGEIIIGAEGVEHDALLTKLAEARDELFGYERMLETLMINGPEYVVDEMVSEIRRLRKALEEISEMFVWNSDIRDARKLAREALAIGEESNAL